MIINAKDVQWMLCLCVLLQVSWVQYNRNGHSRCWFVFGIWGIQGRPGEGEHTASGTLNSPQLTAQQQPRNIPK